MRVLSVASRLKANQSFLQAPVVVCFPIFFRIPRAAFRAERRCRPGRNISHVWFYPQETFFRSGFDVVGCLRHLQEG